MHRIDIGWHALDASPVFSLPRVARVGIGPLIAALLLAAIIILTLISPWIAPHDPLAMNPMMRLKPPSDEYLLGTDNYGRDLFSRMILGGAFPSSSGFSRRLPR